MPRSPRRTGRRRTGQPRPGRWRSRSARRGAVPTLTAANTIRATRSAPAPATMRRAPSVPVSCSRRHHRPNVPRRIGVSMTRYDRSATTTVAAIATGNSGSGQRVAGDAPDALEDRPVVQVQAVAAHPDPHQHDVAHRRPGGRAPVRDGRDHGDRRQARDQEPAAEQPRVGAVGGDDMDVPRQRAEGDEPDHADDVEQPAAPAHRPAHQGHRAPHHRQRRAEQQTAGPRRRRQVQEVGLRDAPIADLPVGLRGQLARGDRTGVVERGDDAGDGHGRGDERPADVLHPPRPEAQDDDHHQRPQQVELLLHGQAPQVAQRGEVAGRGVPLADPDLVPVGHVGEPGDHVAAQLTEGIAPEHRRVRRQQRSSVVNSAGSSRRARADQNWRRRTRPVRSCSPISSSVIR